LSTVKQITNEKWINLAETEHNGHKWTYATRSKDLEALPKCDAVIIAALFNDSLVVTKEYRPAIKNYEWGLPAGLVDKDETIKQAAIRELKEETGLSTVEVLRVSPLLASSAGLTDECVKIVWVDCTGYISNRFQEPNEDIEIMLCDYNDIVRMVNSTNKIIGSKAYGVFIQYLTQRGWSTYD
jgi:ADP-ribose pyrophosphatase